MEPIFARCTGRRDANPGPGAYETRGKLGGPSWTMKGRHEQATRPITAPYRSLPSTVGSGPKISLASRHKERTGDDTPGPSYIPPGIGSDARKSTMASRHTPLRSSMADTPGPGAYTIEAKFANDAPKATLHGRTGTNDASTASPGPGAYMPNMDAVKRRAPSASMHIRTKLHQPEDTPGYYNIGSTLQGPKFTIGRREGLDLIAV